MTYQFSTQPGPRERHLKRRMHNPLFPEQVRNVQQQDITDAQQQDEKALLDFMTHFQNVVRQATELNANTESDVILKLKEQLDECYAICCAMPGEQAKIKTAINSLIAAIMKAIRKGAENDPVAMSKLDEEDIARKMHNNLHNHAIIADLMMENSPIEENELTATLLNETEEAVNAVLQLFTEEQMSIIYNEAQDLLNSLRSEGHELPQAWLRFDQIKQALAEATSMMEKN